MSNVVSEPIQRRDTIVHIVHQHHHQNIDKPIIMLCQQCIV